MYLNLYIFVVEGICVENILFILLILIVVLIFYLYVNFGWF